MKVSQFVFVLVSFTVLIIAGCSQETAVDNATGGSVSNQISAAGTIIPGVTGGGTFPCQDGEGSDVIVTHGFTLRCDGGPNKLQLNWNGNRFLLENIDERICDEDTEEGDEEFEIEIDGTGRFNGESGAVICASFADSGEPGASEDEVGIILLEEGGTCEFDDEGEFTGDVILLCDEELLISGDHNAH
ncbi:hypothetical protein L0222_19655 [bacterium]|nr:hypothetical protein [bacterium]MCI0602726.1 hypothetical protein [bacterium]